MKLFNIERDEVGFRSKFPHRIATSRIIYVSKNCKNRDVERLSNIIGIWDLMKISAINMVGL